MHDSVGLEVGDSLNDWCLGFAQHQNLYLDYVHG